MGANERSRLRNCRPGLLTLAVLAAGSLLVWLPASHAQATGPRRAEGSSKPDAPVARKEAPQKEEHRFWDKENDWLFAGVGTSRTLDYFSTLNMRRCGRQEILLTNDVLDNHAAFAAVEAAATAVSIGAGYLFHRYEHHKLERWTSLLHIGLATTGSARNYCLKTAHLAVTPNAP